MTYVLLLVVGLMTVVSLALRATAQTRHDEPRPAEPVARPVAPNPGNPFTTGGPQVPAFARGVLDREGAAAEYERLIRQGMHPREAEETARLRHTANTATETGPSPDANM